MLRRTFSPILSRGISKYEQEIETISRQFRIEPELVRSIIRVESAFNPSAISVKGAQGLMQLMPGTAQDLRVTNPFDPRENIRGGVTYLRYLLDLFEGDLVLALAAYNAGENAVLRYQGVPPYPETMAYVEKVLALYDPSLGSQLPRIPRKNRVASRQGGDRGLSGAGANSDNKIYRQVRDLDGQEIIVYTNVPVSRRRGMD